MEIRLLNDKELSAAYRQHLRPAFPEAELRPLEGMRELTRQGQYRPWGLWDNDALVGEALIWACADGWGLFDYLCVAPERRNGGLGAALIAAVREAERGCVLFGEAEIPEYAPEPTLAARRLGFYRRCGARQAGYTAAIFGVPYYTLLLTEDAVDEAALQAVHQAAYRSRLGAERYARFIRIPWDISMGLPEKHPWEE